MSVAYDAPWRNSRYPDCIHTQLCRPDELESCNSKLYNVIIEYGCAFDDYWEYWVTKKGNLFYRVPLWQRQRRPHWTERHRKYEPNHKLDNWNGGNGE